MVGELAAETTRRLALVTAGKPAPASYSVGGKSVQWTEYVSTMTGLIKDANALVVAAGGDGGLYEITARGYT